MKQNYSKNKAEKRKPENSFEVEKEAELLAFLLEKMPNKSRHNVKGFLTGKQVLVDGKIAKQYNYALKIGQKVSIRDTKAPEEQRYRGLTIIFEDEYLIIIEKQEGTLSISTEKDALHNAYSTLSDHVKKQDPKNRIFVVHRLDRETSGLMMFAKSQKMQKLLQESWNATIEQRTYLAVVEGYVEKNRGTIKSYLVESKALIVYSTKNREVGKEAITHYEVLAGTEDYTLLKVNLKTGRKNQIRVHFQDLKHSVVGDRKYGSTSDPIGRLGLHAWVLSFTHPMTGEELYFETEVPRKFLLLFS
ncbi:MAG: RluA family pseudouridine synthase [Bacteroidetes bacterium]|nr:MAG: RluA family pseudouridine synthase [Bacteroidota bacterium]